MNKIINFFKDYWITICIYIAMILGYKIIADYHLLNAFLFCGNRTGAWNFAWNE